jgi:hypothetical protein
MCTRDDHRHCQELCPILEVTKNAKSSTAIAHIERDLEDIDGTFEKIKSDIKKNISDIDKKKRNQIQRFHLCMKPHTAYLETGQCLFRNFRY